MTWEMGSFEARKTQGLDASHRPRPLPRVLTDRVDIAVSAAKIDDVSLDHGRGQNRADT
jgi:hypothetical protein